MNKIKQAKQFYQMQAELLEQREKVAALTNSNDLFQEDNKNKDALIEQQVKEIYKLAGGQSCLLGQHVGVLIEKKWFE